MKFKLVEELLTLNEAKADTQRLIDFAGEDLANRFLEIKKRLKSPENDIYYWIKNKSVDDLERVVSELENSKSSTQQRKDAGDGAKLVAENNYWKVYHITTFEASQKYGRDTKWCITGALGDGSFYWDNYIAKGVQFYFCIAKDNYDTRGKDSKFAIAHYTDKDGFCEVYNQQDVRVWLSDIPNFDSTMIPGVDLVDEDDSVAQCDECGCMIDLDSIDSGTFGPEGQMLCSDCFDRICSICDSCGEICYIGELTQTYDSWVCGTCLSRYYEQCDKCGWWCPKESFIKDEKSGEVFCPACEQIKGELEESMNEEFIGNLIPGEHYYFTKNDNIYYGVFKRKTHAWCIFENDDGKEILAKPWCNVSDNREELEQLIGLVDKMEKDVRVPSSVPNRFTRVPNQHYKPFGESKKSNGFRFKLVEEAQLNEDIAAVRNNYPTISDEDFDRIIKLDPTFVDGRDSVGQYGKWLLNLFKKGKLDNEGHVTDVLNRFEENKKNLKNKDIGQFKSLEDVDAYLNDDNNYKDKSHRQEVRDRQKDRKKADLNNEAVKVFDSSNWEVWVPKTYAASCKLGQGSSWCTASTESDHYYNYYSNEGNLYINLNKHNSEEKYQFHFETNSFMDINDRSIDVGEFFSSNPDLKEFYRPKILESLGIKESDIDEDGNVKVFIDDSDFDELFGDLGKFVTDLLQGDVWNYYDTGYDYSAMSIDNLPDFSDYPQYLKDKLSKLDIIDNDSLEQALDEDTDLEDAFRRAYADGCLYGVESEALDDLEGALSMEGAKLVDGQIEWTVSVEDLLGHEYFDEGYDYKGIAVKALSDELSFREPYYGWSGFSEDTFYERLSDELYEVLGD
jgi:hypothetical protein